MLSTIRLCNRVLSDLDRFMRVLHVGCLDPRAVRGVHSVFQRVENGWLSLYSNIVYYAGDYLDKEQQNTFSGCETACTRLHVPTILATHINLNKRTEEKITRIEELELDYACKNHDSNSSFNPTGWPTGPPIIITTMWLMDCALQNYPVFYVWPMVKRR